MKEFSASAEGFQTLKITTNFSLKCCIFLECEKMSRICENILCLYPVLSPLVFMEQMLVEGTGKKCSTFVQNVLIVKMLSLWDAN